MAKQWSAVQIGVAHGNVPLPSRALPTARCRVDPHGKGVAVQKAAFAVPDGRTATAQSPVVSLQEKNGVAIGLF